MLPLGPVSCFCENCTAKSLYVRKLVEFLPQNIPIIQHYAQHIMSVEAKSQLRMDPPESGCTYVYKTVPLSIHALWQDYIH